MGRGLGRTVVANREVSQQNDPFSQLDVFGIITAGA